MNRVLMDITQLRLEIADVIYRLTTKAVLEQMAVTLVFLVEMVCVRYGDALNNLTNGCRLFLNEQMNMVGH